MKKTTARTTNANSEKSAIDLEAQIRCRAYEVYERRGREAGHEIEDWLQAEAELALERTQTVAAQRIKTNSKTPVARTAKAKAVKKSRPAAQTTTKQEETSDGH